MFLNPHHYTLQLHEEIFFFHSHTYFNRHIVGIFEIVKGQKVYLSSRPDLFHHAISPISGHKIRERPTLHTIKGILKNIIILFQIMAILMKRARKEPHWAILLILQMFMPPLWAHLARGGPAVMVTLMDT